MAEGIQAMVLGMGMVYVFLVIMIIMMGIMAKFLAPFAGLLEKAPAPVKSKTPAPGKLSEQDRILASAAIAAVRMHRGDSK